MSAAPPHDLGIERVVLGSMLLKPSLVDEIAAIVGDSTGFYDARHGMIYKAILAAQEAGEPIEPAAIAARLAVTGDINRVGGAVYLAEVLSAVPVADNGPFYARKVAALAKARELDILARRTHDWANSLAMENPNSAIELIRRRLDELESGTEQTDFTAWSDMSVAGIDGLMSAGDALAPVSTGLPALDEALGGGLTPGQVIVVAGRTSMGKSVLARNFARAAAFTQKLVVGMFSVEMHQQELFNSFVSAEMELNYHRVKTNKLTDQEWLAVANWLGELGEAQLYVNDSESITLAEIRAKARRLKKTVGLDLLIIDYLQLVDAVGSENRQLAVAEMSRGFKKLAKELMVPVVLLSQLNRGPEHRVDKRPQKSDLRESGAIENDANVIILIHREDYYDKDSSRKGEADLIIAKNRDGEMQDVVVAAQLHFSRFSDPSLPPKKAKAA